MAQQRGEVACGNRRADPGARIGYDDGTIKRVQALVKQEKLKQNPEAQLVEDASCLVFLKNHLAEFATRHDEETLLRVLHKI